MNKTIKTILLLSFIAIICFFILSTNKAMTMEEPNKLIYKAKGSSWEGLIEIEQSINNSNKKFVGERHYFEYIGKEASRLENEKNPIEWEVDSILSSSKKSDNYLSEFNSEVGTDEGGYTLETNTSNKFANENDNFQIKIKWDNNKEETLELECVAWE